MSHGEKWLVLGLIFPVDSFVLVVEYYRAWKRYGNSQSREQL